MTPAEVEARFCARCEASMGVALASNADGGLLPHAAEVLRALGRRFRDTVLARGGGQDPTEVFVEFRGQEPTPAALLRARGIVSRAAAGE